MGCGASSASSERDRARDAEIERLRDEVAKLSATGATGATGATAPPIAEMVYAEAVLMEGEEEASNVNETISYKPEPPTASKYSEEEEHAAAVAPIAIVSTPNDLKPTGPCGVGGLKVLGAGLGSGFPTDWEDPFTRERFDPQNNLQRNRAIADMISEWKAGHIPLWDASGKHTERWHSG